MVHLDSQSSGLQRIEFLRHVIPAPQVSKLTYSRVSPFEAFGSDPDILGQIETAAMFENETVKFVKQRKQPRFDLEVERQGIPFQGEGQPAGVPLSKKLQHGKKGPFP